MIQRLLDWRERVRTASRALAWLPPLLARASVGLTFVGTGWGKLHNLEHVIDFFRSLHIPFPEVQAPFVAATELGCGTLLALGLLTRGAAIPLIGTMVVAIATAIWPELDGPVDLLGREEFLFIVLLVWLVVSGGGPISLDGVLVRSLRASGPVRA